MPPPFVFGIHSSAVRWDRRFPAGAPRSSWHSLSSSTAKHTRGGTRTRNLLLRREAPYPLGHTSVYSIRGCCFGRVGRRSPWQQGSVAVSQAVCLCKTTPVGFEPTRGDPIGLAGRRLNHSAKVSSGQVTTSSRDRAECWGAPPRRPRPSALFLSPPLFTHPARPAILLWLFCRFLRGVVPPSPRVPASCSLAAGGFGGGLLLLSACYWTSSAFPSILHCPRCGSAPCGVISPCWHGLHGGHRKCWARPRADLNRDRWIQSPEC